MVSIEINPDFGYVVLAASGAFVLNMWQSFRIGGARKRFGVKYPDMYSDKHPQFNCYQRAHQNTLESVPFYLSLLLAAGIRYPCYAAGFGAAWLVGRVAYTIGYSTGNPEARIPGAILSILGLLPLFGLSVATGAKIAGLL